MSVFGTRKGAPLEPWGAEHGTVQRVASQLGYGTESVRSWFAQADVANLRTIKLEAAGVGAPLPSWGQGSIQTGGQSWPVKTRAT